MYHKTRDVATMLNVSYKTVWNWIRAGKLHAVKSGRDWRVSDQDIHVFLTSRKEVRHMDGKIGVNDTISFKKMLVKSAKELGSFTIAKDTRAATITIDLDGAPFSDEQLSKVVAALNRTADELKAIL